MKRIVIPHLSANVTEATLTRWLRNMGDRLSAGDPVVELTTDKAVFEVESPADGILLECLAPPRGIYPVGHILGIVGAPGEHDQDAEAHNRDNLARHAERELGAPASDAAALGGASPSDTPSAATRRRPAAGRVRATPKARRLARERGIDLDQVREALGDVVINEARLAQWQNVNKEA